MPRIVHFEIHTLSPEKAIDFYSSVFGWQFSKWDGPIEYWLISTGTGPGIDGGMMRRQGPAPIEGAAVNSYVNTITVDNLDEITQKISNKSGKLVVPKKAIPSMGWLAYFMDIDGNIFGVMQPDTTAK
jgi:predicted enzyme related to lactoylglutathione lyase